MPSRFETSPHEQVLTWAHPHWVCLIGPVSALCLGVCVQAAASWYQSTQDEAVAWLWVPAAVITATALGWLVEREIHRRYTRFTLTTRRVVYETGVLTRRHWETSLAAVTAVLVNANLAERVLGLGDIIIESPTDSAAPVIGDIADPQHVREMLLAAQHDASGPAAGPAGAPSWGTATQDF